MMIVLMNKRGRRSLGELFEVSPEGGQDLKTFDMDAKKLDLKIGDELSPAYTLAVIEPGAEVTPVPSPSVEEVATDMGSESSVDSASDEPESLNNEDATGGAQEGDGSPGREGGTGVEEGESGGGARTMEKMNIELSPGNIPAAAYCVKHLASSPNPTSTPEAPENDSSSSENDPSGSGASGASGGGDDGKGVDGSSTTMSEGDLGEDSTSKIGSESANFAETVASLSAEADAIGGDGGDALDDYQADSFAAANPA
eukprot:g102.t1